MANSKLPPAMSGRPSAATAVKTAAAMKAPIVVKSAMGGAPAVKAGTGAMPAMVAASGEIKSEALFIAFVDLTRFQIASRRVKDAALVEILEEYYDRVADSLKPAGGRVVKVMGDGVLVVFPLDRASQGARALLMLKSDVDARMTKRKFPVTLVARVNAGEVMAGPIGPKGDKRYDVIGQAVNRAATLRLGEGVSMTAEAWGKLDAKTQKLFRARGDFYVPA